MQKKTLKEVFQSLKENEVNFYVPSILSGSRKHLDGLLQQMGLIGNWPGYESTSLGGQALLNDANALGFYTYVDMGSYALYKAEIDNIIPLFRDDVRLNNFYTITVVKESRVGRPYQPHSLTFFQFITSPEIQQYIQEFGVKNFDMDLYRPYAAFDETIISLNKRSNRLKNAVLIGLISLGGLLALGLGWFLYRSEKNKKLRLASEQISLRDDLTQIGNRRLFHRDIDLLLKNKAPFALLLVDLCGFKSVNDTYGHLCGDAVLQSVARNLSEHLDLYGQVWSGYTI